MAFTCLIKVWAASFGVSRKIWLRPSGRMPWDKDKCFNTQETQPMDRRKSNLTSSSKVATMCHRLPLFGFLGGCFADGHHLPKIPETSCGMKSESQKARASATGGQPRLPSPSLCLLMCLVRTSPKARRCSLRVQSYAYCRRLFKVDL